MSDVVNPYPWHEPLLTQLLAARETLPHAMLLHGLRGTGKLALARALAAALLCETPADGGRACGKCAACHWFSIGNHPDFKLVEPVDPAREGVDDDSKSKKRTEKKATTITVAQIRELPDFVNISSHRNGRKVIVVHPAEAMNTQAANALLKTLEEPPRNTYFLLVSNQYQRLSATIRSRCRLVPVPLPQVEAAAEWLRGQGVAAPDVLLARAGNAPLAALETAGADDENDRRRFLEQLAVPERIDVLTLADSVQKLPLEKWVNWLVTWTYDIASQQLAGAIRYNPEYRDAIFRLAERAAPLSVLRYHRRLLELQPVLNHPLNPRLFGEQLLLNYIRAI